MSGKQYLYSGSPYFVLPKIAQMIDESKLPKQKHIKKNKNIQSKFF